MKEVRPEQLVARGVGEEYVDRYFYNFPGSTENVLKVWRYARSIKASRAYGNSTLVWGDNGLGKTSLSVCTVRAALRQGLEAHYFSFPILLGLWFDDDSWAQERALTSDVDLLVLDDVGKEQSPGGKRSQYILSLILRTRRNNKLCTMVVTDEDIRLNYLRKIYGNEIANILSRYKQIHVHGERITC
jgi:DNA replication protein DnaC